MASNTPDAPLLGVCDGELDGERHRSSFLTNKVGGRPDWLPLLSHQSPGCGRCGAPLALVVQVYCPLEASPYHRNIHLFACPGPECSGRAECWRALRSQGLEAAGRPAPVQEAPLAATDWCESADDWGPEEDGWSAGSTQPAECTDPVASHVAGEDDASSRLQSLRLDDLQTPAVFCPFFISVVEESDLGGKEDELAHAQELLREYERREGLVVAELEGGGGEEKYEKTSAHHGDAVFSRFMKKISLCPQQILRYCRGGEPLFISLPPSNLAQQVQLCSACGGARTFELQLMPALVSLLRGVGGSGEAGLEFGTVLVYTCSSSCWTEAWTSAVDEFCYVQTDPDQQLFT
ncbi:programmed cell death protein 2-like [Aulostomus maculatus]